MRLFMRFDMFRKNRKNLVGTGGGRGSQGSGPVSETMPKPVEGAMHNNMKGRDKIKIDLLIHDLKVPLAVIEAGISSLLNRREKYGPLTETQEKVLLRALRNTKITQMLVNDAMELGRSRQGIICTNRFKLSNLIEQALVELFDLADAAVSEEIKGCVDLMRFRDTLQAHGVILKIEEDLWCREICLDEVKLRQILRNLLNNALKYRKRQVELRVREEDGCLVISVKDDGEGIPRAYHQKIFESYFQIDVAEISTVRGHGLGLAGVQVLVEDMGGNLTLESDTGMGANFSVKFPCIFPIDLT